MDKTLTDDDEVRSILKAAVAQAKKLNISLAMKVIKASKLHKIYDDNPLDIVVPFFGALLRGRPDMLLFVKQRWNSLDGFTTEVSGLRLRIAGHTVPDGDGFSISQIASSSMPEISYIWLVDWIRVIQSILFFIPELFGAELPRLDLWGSILYKSGTGGDVFILPMVTHPAAMHVRIKAWSKILEAGSKSMGTLVDRADEHKVEVDEEDA